MKVTKLLLAGGQLGMSREVIFNQNCGLQIFSTA